MEIKNSHFSKHIEIHRHYINIKVMKTLSSYLDHNYIHTNTYMSFSTRDDFASRRHRQRLEAFLFVTLEMLLTPSE